MDMVNLKEIQRRIAESIRDSGMTQQELAHKIGVRQPQISCYLNGKKMPALDTFANLCKALDISADEILGTDSK